MFCYYHFNCVVNNYSSSSIFIHYPKTFSPLLKTFCETQSKKRSGKVLFSLSKK